MFSFSRASDSLPAQKEKTPLGLEIFPVNTLFSEMLKICESFEECLQSIDYKILLERMFKPGAEHVLWWKQLDDGGTSRLQFAIRKRLVDELFCRFGVEVLLLDDLSQFNFLLLGDKFAPITFYIRVVVD